MMSNGFSVSDVNFLHNDWTKHALLEVTDFDYNRSPKKAKTAKWLFNRAILVDDTPDNRIFRFQPVLLDQMELHLTLCILPSS